MSYRQSPIYTICNAQAADGAGIGVAFSQEFKTDTMIVVADAAAAMTVKFVGSMKQDVDFSSPSTVANPWDYVQAVDLSNGNPVNGTTGIVLTGAGASTKQYELNLNGMSAVSAIVSGYSAGSITIFSRLFNNE